MAEKSANSTSQPPHDLDNFMKSKSISDISLKTIILVIGTLLTVAGGGYAVRLKIEEYMTKKTAELPQPTYTTPSYDAPSYPAPVLQERSQVLFAPVLFTRKVGGSGCIDKFIAAAKSAGATVQPSSLYTDGVFMITASLLKNPWNPHERRLAG